MDNAYIETFNGSLSDESLNTDWFMSLEDAQELEKRLHNLSVSITKGFW